MSHKIAVPPMAPFPHTTGDITGTVIVDGKSTSQHEDGSWANPYKTISAAMAACPAPPGVGVPIIWNVQVVPGVYPEHVTLPPQAMTYMTVLGTGYVIIGTLGGAAKNVSWTPVEWAGPPIQTPLVDMSGSFFITGNLNLSTTNTVSSCQMTLHKVTVGGQVLATPITTPNKVRLEVEDCTVQGAVTASCLMRPLRTNFVSPMSVHGFEAITDCQFGATVNVTTAGVESIKQCNFSVDLNVSPPGISGEMSDVDIGGNLGTVVSTMKHVHAGGPTTLGTVNRMEDCTFNGPLTFMGSTPEIFDSTFSGLVTCTVNPLGRVHGSYLSGGILLAAIPTGFFGCIITGNFTGPAGSYKVDSPTAGGSSPTLLGGATLNLLSPTLTGLVTSATLGSLPSGGSADVSLSLMTGALITGFHIRRVGGTSGSANVAYYTDAGFGTKVMAFFGNTMGGGAPVAPTWNSGPTVDPFADGSNRSFPVIFPYPGVPSAAVCLRVTNTDMAFAGTFEVAVSYTPLVPTLPA